MHGLSTTRLLGPRRIDIDAAAIGLVVAIVLFPLRFLASDIYVETIPVVLGSACLVYLLAAYRGRTDTSTPTLPLSVTGYLPGLVLAGIGVLVLVATIAGGRTPLFYDVAGLVGALVVIQILFTGDRELSHPYVLGEIVLLAAVVRFAGLYPSAGYIGIDVWTHQVLVERIASAGSLSAIADDKHFVAPLYHLLVVTTAMFAEVPQRAALYLSVGVVMPISVVFVFAASRFLVSSRWALFAAAVYAIGDYAIEWGLHLIPTSLGLVFFLGVVYAMIRVMQTDYRAREFLLLAGLTLAVIFTHQVSSFVMLVLLGAGVVAQYLLSHPRFRPPDRRRTVFGSLGPVDLVGLTVFDVGLLTLTWSFTPYRGETFLETFGSFLVRTLFSDAGFLNLANPSSTPGTDAGRPPTVVEQLATYVDTVGFLLLLGLTVVGSLYVLRRSRAKHAPYTLVVATAAMAVFVFGLPLFGVRNFVPQRWFAFMYVGMAILSAVGVRHLAKRIPRRAFMVAMVLFAVAFPTVMVMSSNGAIDNPVFSNERARLAYTAPEVAAVETIGSLTVGPSAAGTDATLYTDHPYQTVFTRSGAARADTARLATGRPASHDAVVYREEQTRGATFFRTEDDTAQLSTIPPRRLCRPSSSVLYSNGPVRLCVTA